MYPKLCEDRTCAICYAQEPASESFSGGAPQAIFIDEASDFGDQPASEDYTGQEEAMGGGTSPPNDGQKNAEKPKAEKPQVIRGVLQRFPYAMAAVADVSAFGCKKYNAEPGSLDYLYALDPFGRYTDALGRHLTAEITEGLVNQTDGGVLHAAQVAWNALARLEVLLRELKAESDAFYAGD